LTAQTGQFQSDLAKSGQAVNKFGSQAAGVGEKLKGLLAPLAGLAGIASAGAFFSKGVIDAAQLEKDVLAIKTLTGSVDIAEQTMRDLQDFAAGTPFQMQDLTTATKQLLAFGIEASKIQETLTMLGNLAAVSGASVTELAQIFGKVKAQGKVTAETLDQMAERAIPVTKALAEHFGVPEEAIRKMVSEGKVSFAELQAALQGLAGEGGELGNAMAEQANTLAGKYSTLMDNISLLGVEIAQAFLPTMKDLLDNLIASVQALIKGAKAIKEWGDGLSDATGGLISFNSAMKVLKYVAYAAAIPAIIRLIKVIKNLAKAALAAQVSTGVGLVTAVGSLVAMLAVEAGAESIFSSYEDDAESAGEAVNGLIKDVDELKKQGEEISASAITPTEKQTESQKFAESATDDQLIAQQQKLREESEARVAEMKRLNDQLLEQQRLGENATMTEEERVANQERINELKEEQNEAQQQYLDNEKEIEKREKERARIAEQQKKRAADLVKSARTQTEIYQDQLAEVRKLEQAGAFSTDPKENRRLAEKARAKITAKIDSDIDKIIDNQNKQEKQRLDAWEKAADNAAKKSTSDLVRFGSKKMFEMIAKEQFKKENPLATFQKKSNKLQQDQLTTLRSIDRHLQDQGEAQHAQPGAVPATAIDPASLGIDPVVLGE
tara:strand:- start:16129 stop:18126 length:1998 start_codon:yes stop_codon:yes gene_type:complete